MFVLVLRAQRLAIPAVLSLARRLMRSINQLPVQYVRAIEGKQQKVRDCKATVFTLLLAIAELVFWVEGCCRLRGSKLKQWNHSMFCECMPRRHRSGNSQTVASRSGRIMGH
jgi:hypothetical protein